MNTFAWTQFENDIIAFTTTLEMGNMAFQVGDNPDEVRKNRKAVLSLLKLPFKERLITTYQTHSDILEEVTFKDQGKGASSFESGVLADALYTKDKRIALGIFHADCVPLFFYVPSLKIVGIIHAGFKGTLKHIAYKSMMTLMEKEGITPNDIYVYIGPARGVQSFIVNEDNVKEIIESKCIDSLKNVNGEEHFDAIKSNTLDLQKAGISLTHILSSNIDTTENENCFSAYKKTPLGRMMSVIKLK